MGNIISYYKTSTYNLKMIGSVKYKKNSILISYLIKEEYESRKSDEILDYYLIINNQFKLNHKDKYKYTIIYDSINIYFQNPNKFCESLFYISKIRKNNKIGCDTIVIFHPKNEDMETSELNELCRIRTLDYPIPVFNTQWNLAFCDSIVIYPASKNSVVTYFIQNKKIAEYSICNKDYINNGKTIFYTEDGQILLYILFIDGFVKEYKIYQKP